MSVRVAITGSFGPVTRGHLNIIERAAAKFDEVFVVLMVNPDKQLDLTIEARLDLIKKATKHLENVKAVFYDGYAIEFCLKNKIDFIVRGIRNHKDLVYEEQMAAWNKEHGNIDTLFFIADEDLVDVSSYLVRNSTDVIKAANKYLPESIVRDYLKITGIKE